VLWRTSRYEQRASLCGEVSERTPSLVPNFAAVNPIDVATEAASRPAREISLKLRFMLDLCPVPAVSTPPHARSATSVHLSPGTTHDPITGLPCCAFTTVCVCALRLFSSRRLVVSSVRQLPQTLTALQTKYCSSRILDGLSAVTEPNHSQSILETILFNDDICRYDAVVLIDHPGVCASPRSYVFRLNFEIAQGFPPEAVGPTRPPCSQCCCCRVLYSTPVHSLPCIRPPIW